MIVYCGHNEFGSRLHGGRDVVALHRRPGRRAPGGCCVEQVEAVSPLCELIRQASEKCRLEMPPSTGGDRDLIDRPAYTARRICPAAGRFPPPARGDRVVCGAHRRARPSSSSRPATTPASSPIARSCRPRPRGSIREAFRRDFLEAAPARGERSRGGDRRLSRADRPPAGLRRGPLSPGTPARPGRRRGGGLPRTSSRRGTATATRSAAPSPSRTSTARSPRGTTSSWSTARPSCTRSAAADSSTTTSSRTRCIPRSGVRSRWPRRSSARSAPAALSAGRRAAPAPVIDPSRVRGPLRPGPRGVEEASACGASSSATYAQGLRYDPAPRRERKRALCGGLRPPGRRRGRRVAGAAQHRDSPSPSRRSPIADLRPHVAEPPTLSRVIPRGPGASSPLPDPVAGAARLGRRASCAPATSSPTARPGCGWRSGWRGERGPRHRRPVRRGGVRARHRPGRLGRRQRGRPLGLFAGPRRGDGPGPGAAGGRHARPGRARDSPRWSWSAAPSRAASATGWSGGRASGA